MSVKRYDFESEYNYIACQDQVVEIECKDGLYVKYKDYKKLQAENAELKKRSQWGSGLVNGHSDWAIGEKAIAINFDSDKPYAFEIEWDGDCWCSIGGEEFTHWMPLPTPPEGE